MGDELEGFQASLLCIELILSLPCSLNPAGLQSHGWLIASSAGWAAEVLRNLETECP